MRIKISYKKFEFLGNNVDVEDEVNVEKLLSIVEQAVSGEVSYLRLEKGNRTHYFGKKVLEKSIITIIE